MSSFEFNKIFAALLCALLTVWLAWFGSYLFVHPKDLEKDAVTIEGAEDDHGGGGEAAGPALPEPIMHLIATADIEKGAKLSKACAACHAFEKGGATKQGPALWGVIGHAKGTHEGFDYSEGMKTKGGVWDYASLNEFLWKPKKYIEGTKMNFIGLKKPEDRAAMIAWLRQQSDSQAALPTEAEIAAEAAALAPPPAHDVAAEGAEGAEGAATEKDMATAPAEGEKAEGEVGEGKKAEGAKDGAAPAEKAEDKPAEDAPKADEKKAAH